MFDKFEKDLNERVECADNGLVNYFLGFNVHRDCQQRKLYVGQEFYIESLL